MGSSVCFRLGEGVLFSLKEHLVSKQPSGYVHLQRQRKAFGIPM
jgi:hypothetical protein